MHFVAVESFLLESEAVSKPYRKNSNKMWTGFRWASPFAPIAEVVRSYYRADYRANKSPTSPRRLSTFLSTSSAGKLPSYAPLKSRPMRSSPMP